MNITIADDTITAYYVTTPSGAREAVRALLYHSADLLGLDIETAKKEGFEKDPEAGLCPYRSKIRLIQFYDYKSKTAYAFDMFSIPLEVLIPLLKSNKRFVGHFIQFDQMHLALAGYPDLSVDCTAIMSSIVNCAEYIDNDDMDEDISTPLLDRMSKKDKHGNSLATCVARYLDIYADKTLQASDWGAAILTEEQIAYALCDVYYVVELAKILIPKIKELGMTDVYRLYKRAIHPVVSMQLNGVNIDTAAHKKTIAQWTASQEEAKLEVDSTFGGININSTTQLHSYIEQNVDKKTLATWPKSEKTSKYKADAKTLMRHKNLPFADILLTYKKTSKMLSTYGQSLLDKINPVTNKIHGGYTIGYTATGRLSSRNPNNQNFPHDPNFRKIFVAPYNAVLVGADLSQIEVRVAAELSRDRVLLDVYRTGKDVYITTIAKIMGKPYDKVTDKDRKMGKVLVLGLLYGLGAKGLVDYAFYMGGVTISQEQAYEYHNAFFEIYSGYAAWQREMRQLAERDGVTYTELGKTRKLNKAASYTKSVNHPVQGTSAEIILLAMCKLYERIRTNAEMILSVHDELIIRCDPVGLGTYTDILEECMIAAFLEVFPKGITNGLVEAKVGNTWAELK